MEVAGSGMNESRQLDARNLAWLREQMNLARDLSASVHSLRKLGFSDDVILESIESIRPRGDALSSGVHLPPLIRRQPANLHKLNHPEVDLYTLDGFLSAK